MKMLRIPQAPATKILGTLRHKGFPIDRLVSNPVSAIEGMAFLIDNKFFGICGRACIGCSANALHPKHAKGFVRLMTSQLLRSILVFAQNLACSNAEILSTDRLNLFSGSNELDHPNCIALRKLVSRYFQNTHGFHYGSISSDLIFHVSPANVFKSNLQRILVEPTLFDNICIAIDEQIPFNSKNQYFQYLDTLSWVWDVLKPVLQMKLEHANPKRYGTPRVILNLLLPSSENSYREEYLELYPGGPLRASTYSQLMQRYIEPFVGRLRKAGYSIPHHHVFTTAIGTLEYVPKSLVFISESVFEPVGRANLMLKIPNLYSKGTLFRPCIRTKIYPVNETAFAVQASLAPNRFSDGALSWDQVKKPLWVKQMSEFAIDTSEYLTSNDTY